MNKFYSISSKPGKFGQTLYTEAFKHLKIDASYTPLKLEKNEFRKFMDIATKLKNVKGVSVSMPFKKMAYNYVDYQPITIGNINTIVIDSGETTGYNTDYLAIEEVYKNFLSANSALIYGTGAMADSIKYSLLNLGVTCLSAKRDKIKMLSEADNIDFLVNATPIGMSGIKDNVFTEDVVSRFQYVMDVVVSREPTNLIKLAKKLKKPHIRGWEISLEQWKEQFYIYTGRQAPVELAKQLLKENGYE